MRKFGMMLCTLVFILNSSGYADSESIQNLDEFERIPILENGRKMPLHTFAENKLIEFSGRRKVNDLPAIDWLAKCLFEPSTVQDFPVFLINHPRVAEAMGVENVKGRRYTFNQLEPGLPKLVELASKAMQLEQNARSPVEQELIRVYGVMMSYFGFIHAFQFAEESADFAVEDPEVRAFLGLSDAQITNSFYSLFGHLPEMRKAIASWEGKPPEEWSAIEKDVYRLANTLFTWSRRNRGMNFNIVPLDPHGEEIWLSIWDTMSVPVSDSGLKKGLENLSRLPQAYRDGDEQQFNELSLNYRQFVQSRFWSDRDMRHLDREVGFNKQRFFSKAKWIYGLAFFLSFFAVVSPSRGWRWTAGLSVLVAFGYHTAGMILRMLIMGRPPVTNLYATFIFVAFVCVLLGLLMELFQRRGFGLLAASFTGLVLLMISSRFAVSGDTMGKVVAVLDSNFWLSTHVTAITAGYAGCFLAGVLGHLYLIFCIADPKGEVRQKSIYHAMVAILGFGLTFSFLGTMLGGVWADQSWGRFWGWDPKENGALLIVLWCSILFHARIDKMVGDRGMALGNILGMIVVMLAWLGVNLLGVGLHSYGFTSGLAVKLYTYVLLQIVVGIALFAFAKRTQKEKY